MSADAPLAGKRSLPTVLARAAFGVLLMAAVPSGAVGDGPSQPARIVDAGPTKTVVYGGATFDVPAAWPVYRLSPGSTRCVRFDVHAVYLGHQGRQPTCPATAIGRVDAVQVEPLDQASAERLGIRTGSVDRSNPVAHELVVADPAVGIVATATYASHDGRVRRILDSIRPTTSPTGPVASLPVRLPVIDVLRPRLTTYTGEGFDACTAPSTSTMNAWLSSPYRSVGVYIGGVARACAQGNLTSSWVTMVTQSGWKLIPTYVGLQAPCTSFTNRITPSKAASQGTAAADDAVSQARSLGLGRRTPIYFDMEAYDSSNASCVSAVRAFISAWVGELHAKGYVAGMYSSVASGIRDQADVYNDPSYNRLDAVWFAHWDGRHAVYGDPYLPDSVWNNHRRLHQYLGGHNETWGGVTINVDSDYDDGPAFGTR